MDDDEIEVHLDQIIDQVGKSLVSPDSRGPWS